MKLIRKTENKSRYHYIYKRKDFTVKEIFIYKNRYTKEELEFIDSLFNSIDESNLVIIKAFVNRKNGLLNNDNKL